jgi:hypothetical protein
MKKAELELYTDYLITDVTQLVELISYKGVAAATVI